MTADTLTDKEKETLRLLLRGHDAKSSARALGLSVHTVNERLRDARRKLGVTSSREAARWLNSHEAQPHQKPVAKDLGDAAAEPIEHHSKPSSASHSERRKAGWFNPRWVGGLIIMSVIATLLAVSLLSGSMGPAADSEARPPAPAPASSEQEQEAAARAWLKLVDQGDWQGSFDAAGKAFRAPNTVAGWQAASEQARVPLGQMTSRKAIAFQYLNAPPHGYQLVQFKSDFAVRAGVVESVTLEREDGAWRVVGYFIQ